MYVGVPRDTRSYYGVPCMEERLGDAAQANLCANTAERHLTDIRILIETFFFRSAFAEFRKTTIIFVMSVRPSLLLSAWNSATTGLIFMKSYI